MKQKSLTPFSGSTVRLEGVGLRYGTADNILNDVSIDLDKGSFTFLTGASGSGKSSLLKLIYLALRPTAGDVRLFGQSTKSLNRRQLSSLRRRIGVVFQEFRLLDHLTAYENAALPLRVAGESEKSYRQDIVELLNWVGLGERLNAKPQTLSGGEQQRVAIARALVAKPDLLIADEPTGNVDPEMATRLMRLFVELNRRLDTTVLIATHDFGVIKELEYPVIRLQNGFLARDNEFGAAS